MRRLGDIVVIPPGPEAVRKAVAELRRRLEAHMQRQMAEEIAKKALRLALEAQPAPGLREWLEYNERTTRRR